MAKQQNNATKKILNTKHITHYFKLLLPANLRFAIIGIIAGAAETKNMPQNAVLFMKTGVCGGFTTFSTFSLETMQLFENGRILSASAYAVLSVLLCLLGVYIGKSISSMLCLT